MQKTNLTAIKNEYIKSLESSKLSSVTTKNYKNDVEQFVIKNGDNFVDNISVTKYLLFIEDRYPSTATYNRKATSLKKFLKYMYDNQYISSPLYEDITHKSSLIDDYRNYLINEGKDKKTVTNYVSDISKFLKWLNVNNISIEKISADTIYIYKNYLQSHLKESTVKRNMIALKNFYNFIDENTNRLIPSSPLIDNSHKYLFASLVALVIVAFTQNTTFEVYTEEIHPNYNSMSKITKTYELSTPLYFKPVKISVTLEDTINSAVPPANNFEIVKPALASDNYNYTKEETLSNMSNGKAVIKKGSIKTTIKSSTINSSSIIHITPTSNTHNQILFIEKQAKGYFVVSINEPLEHDINFNWSENNDSF